MKTQWDYSNLAESYRKRADYSPQLLQNLFEKMDLKPGDLVCDIGAGIGHLTIPLASSGFEVHAVEPNDAMREIGEERTREFQKVKWFEASAENTQQEKGFFKAAFFGSSFNVCDKAKALKEVQRILLPGGWFACMWNHRDLKDPVQFEIEKIISKYVPSYGYGDRRQDQTEILQKSDYLKEVLFMSDRFLVEQTLEECVEAWRSHATLQRQSQDLFDKVIASIENYLNSLHQPTLQVPYETKIWYGQFK